VSIRATLAAPALQASYAAWVWAVGVKAVFGGQHGRGDVVMVAGGPHLESGYRFNDAVNLERRVQTRPCQGHTRWHKSFSRSAFLWCRRRVAEAIRGLRRDRKNALPYDLAPALFGRNKGACLCSYQSFFHGHPFRHLHGFRVFIPLTERLCDPHLLAPSNNRYALSVSRRSSPATSMMSWFSAF
jgi:hypothetical protein